MVNIPLVIFILIMLVIIYQVPIVNIAKSSINVIANNSSQFQITLLQERLNEIDLWYSEAKYFQYNNPTNFIELKKLLRQYRHAIKTISSLDWNNFIKHKQNLHILVKKSVNCFQSTVHSLPNSELPRFNRLLKRLQELLPNIAYQTTSEFYLKNPQLKEFNDNYEIHFTPDWYLNYYGKNPEPNDHYINYNYDWV